MKSLLLLPLLFVSVLSAQAGAPSGINWLRGPDEVREEVVTPPETLPEIAPDALWTAQGLTENEKATLKFLQEKEGITDRMALAVILGNIKQESRFHPNICEGGARINYNQCHRGGYGLIQWTTSFRYWGLGKHAQQIAGNPSTLDTQLSYLVTEVEWKKAKTMFVIPNKSQAYYMRAADIWLGWGIYGNRGYFSQDYYNRLTTG